MDEDAIRDDTANAMRETGISPALIYAYEGTGLIVTTENRRLIPDLELREFDAKVREYYDLNPEEDPNASQPIARVASVRTNLGYREKDLERGLINRSRGRRTRPNVPACWARRDHGRIRSTPDEEIGERCGASRALGHAASSRSVR